MFGDDLPTVGAKIQGEIADLMAKIEVVKKAFKDLRRDASGRYDLKFTSDMSKALDAFAAKAKSGIIQKSIKDALRDAPVQEEGASAAKRFANAWRAQMGKEKFRTPGWLPWLGGGLLAAPAALTGVAGMLGGIGTAAGAAAAGMGALASSAQEVLAPVKNAFQAIDQYGGAGGKSTANLIIANAAALRQVARSGTSGGGKPPPVSPLLQSRIQAEQIRLQATQARLAAATTPSSRLSARATLVSEQGILANYQSQAKGTGASGSGIPGGFGFLQNQNVNYYTMTAAQRKRTIAIAQTPMTGLPTAFKSQVGAIMSERQAYVGLDAAQRKALYSYQMFDNALVKQQQKSQPIVLKLFAQGLQILTPLLKYLHPFAQAAGDALSYLLTEVSKGTQSAGFKDFMNTMLKLSGPAIKGFGQSLINIGVGIGHMMTGFAKSGLAGGMVDGLVKMTGAFAHWTGGKGFTDFLANMKQDAPIVADMLKHLASIVGHIIVALGSGPNQGALKFFDLILGVLDKLASIPGLGGFIYNLVALELTFSKFGSIKATTALWDLAYKSLGKLLLLKFGGFIGGLLGLETTGMTLGTMWKTIGKAVVTFSKDMVVSLAKSIATAATWAASMIASMATAVAAWIAGLLGIDAATAASSAFIIGATGGLILAVAAIAVGIYELYKHWNTVWGFIKRIAKDAWNFIYNGFGKYLLPLLGPVGVLALAALGLYKHWKTIWHDIQAVVHDVWQGIKTILGDLMKAILTNPGTGILWMASLVLRGIADAFGWVPGVGTKLKTAAKDVANWVSDVNKQINNLTTGHTTTLSYHLNLPKGLKLPTGMSGSTAHQFATGTGLGGADPGLAWVGERGPELVYFHGGETVYNNSQSRKMMGYAKGTSPGWQLHGKLPDISPFISAVNGLTTTLASTIGKGLQKEVNKLMAGSGGGIAAYARSFATGQGHPYVWGGNTPAGWDCSGFTSWVYHHFGYNPPRTSEQQQTWATPSGSIPGALVFFYGTGGGASHVGINLGGGKYVGADSPKVGTVVGSSGGNTGYGVPPGGFHGGGHAGAIGSEGRGPQANMELGRSLAASMFGWTGQQWRALQQLWMRESGWKSTARNPTTGAAGIPQDISGNMHGGPRGQIIWGLDYIRNRPDERTPIGAWAHEQRFGSYGRGTKSARRGLAVVGEYGPELVGVHGYASGTQPRAGEFCSVADAGKHKDGLVCAKGHDGRFRWEHEGSVAHSGGGPSAAHIEHSRGASLMQFYGSVPHSGSLKSIWDEERKFLRNIDKYFNGPAQRQRDETVRRQTRHLANIEKHEKDIASKISSAKSYRQSVMSSLSGFADLSSLQEGAGYSGTKYQSAGQMVQSQLQSKLGDLKAFATSLKKLSKAKAPTSLIQQVVALGPGPGTQFANDILAGGPTLMKQISASESEIHKEEQRISRGAASAVYAGKYNSGKDFLKGLKAEHEALSDEFRKLGKVLGREAARWFNVPKSKQPKGFASGTFSASPGWAWVGERGPELMHFAGGESVFPSAGWNRSGSAPSIGFAGASPGGRPAMSAGGAANATPVQIIVNTNEINPRYHAAQLGWELSRRPGP